MFILSFSPLFYVNLYIQLIILLNIQLIYTSMCVWFNFDYKIDSDKIYFDRIDSDRIDFGCWNSFDQNYF